MFIYDNDGKKRKAVEIECINCKSNFFSLAKEVNRGRGKYCSKDCFYEFRRNKIELTCAQCNKSFQRTPSKTINSKSGLYFCSRDCKDKAQRIGGIEAIMPDHYGKAENRNGLVYRRLYKEFNNIEKLICERCGYYEFECGIDIHHIDKNPLNNSKENMMALCACCHRGLHTKLWKL